MKLDRARRCASVTSHYLLEHRMGVELMNTGFAGAKKTVFTMLTGISPYSKVFRNTHWNPIYGLKMGWLFFLISGKRGFAAIFR
jgi:hypothetical protein